MTTLYEGHANIPMEAHFCGKPIVANAVDGVRDSISDGDDGFLVEAADTKTFSERIITLCRSKELREKMGAVGRRNVERFSMEKVMLGYSKLIQQAIEK
jgi:glycosyltransferase involved in cell wall biosynthesis